MPNCHKFTKFCVNKANFTYLIHGHGSVEDRQVRLIRALDAHVPVKFKFLDYLIINHYYVYFYFREMNVNTL